LAVREKATDPFSVVELNYQAPKADGTAGTASSDRAGVTTLLRCCGHDGAVEHFQLFQFLSVFFNFAPAPAPGRPVLARPPVGEEARIRARDCLLKVARRWNGEDELNAAPIHFVVAGPHAARGRYTLLLPRGAARAEKDPPDPSEVRIHVYREMRANQPGANGFWQLDDLEVERDGSFTAAHEIGHALSLPDEYFNGDFQPALRLPHITESGRSPGTPYGHDRDAIMVSSRRPRARNFWHLVLWARSRSCFQDASEIVVEHGAVRFTAAFTDREHSAVQFPRLQLLDAPVGRLGLCDLFVYLTGHDELTSGLLGGSSPACPYDGIISVRVKLAFTFAERSDFNDMSGMIERAASAIASAFNVHRKLVVTGLFDGKPVRLRVLFAPRFLCRTFPTGWHSEEYLSTDIKYPELPRPDRPSYAARIDDLVSAHRIHADITVDDALPSGLRPGHPRQGAVRDGVLLHFFTSRGFDEDVLQVFSQLIGLPTPGDFSAHGFLPLFAPLAGRLSAIVPELVFE
jgi:hypothetical protein